MNQIHPQDTNQITGGEISPPGPTDCWFPFLPAISNFADAIAPYEKWQNVDHNPMAD